ncbi:hypothetical protein ACK3ZL_14280 [Aeromonas caviae]
MTRSAKVGEDVKVSLLQFEFVTRESSFDLACRFGVARREGGEDADELL